MEPSLDRNAGDFITVSDGCAAIRFQPSVYGLRPILRAGHLFTDRCHVHVEVQPDQTVFVRLRPKGSLDNVRILARDLANEVLDQSLRASLEAETAPVRNLLLAQVFSKVNLLNPVLDGDQPNAPTGS